MFEKEIERKMRKLVEARGGVLYKWVSPGNSGVPDRILIAPDGQVFFVELKTEHGELSALQKWQHKVLSDRRVPVTTLWGWNDAKRFVEEVMPQ